jgi:hypothetical protein
MVPLVPAVSGRFASNVNGRKLPEDAGNLEHQTENHGVGGSIPPLGTIEITRQFAVLKRQDEAVFKVWPAPGQHHIEISLSGACADK